MASHAALIILHGGGGTDGQIILLGGPLLEDGVALEEVDRLEVEA